MSKQKCNEESVREWCKQNGYLLIRESVYEQEITKAYFEGQNANTCEDCISRAELLKAIDTWDKFGVDDTNSLFRLDNLSLPHYVPYIHYDDVIKCIKGMSSVTPKQKMGRWLAVENEDMETVGYYCSECDLPLETEERTPFCPCCGAKMAERGEKK